MKASKASTSMREISEILDEVGDVQGGIAMSTISSAIKSILLSRKKYSRKNISHITLQRFTFTNMLYTQLFINYLSFKDAIKINFLMKQVQTHQTQAFVYTGMHLLGKDVSKWKESSKEKKITLNLLASLSGVKYYNMLDRATDAVQFLNFFKEAAHAVNFETVCESGRKMLEEYLAEMGIELLYTVRLCTPQTSIPRNCVLILVCY